MIVIVVDHQTANVLVGTNLTKLNTKSGLRFILKNEVLGLLKQDFQFGITFYDGGKNKDYALEPNILFLHLSDHQPVSQALNCALESVQTFQLLSESHTNKFGAKFGLSCRFSYRCLHVVAMTKIVHIFSNLNAVISSEGWGLML